MTPFQLTCEQALKPSWAKKRVGERSEPSGAWGRKNEGRDCFAFWCARDILHPAAGRTGLATVKTDQSEASPQIGDWVVLMPPFSFPTLRLLQNTISLIQGVWFKLWLFFFWHFASLQHSVCQCSKSCQDNRVHKRVKIQVCGSIYTPIHLFKNAVGTGAYKRPAVVSGIVIGNTPVSYWPIFSPFPDVFA